MAEDRTDDADRDVTGIAREVEESANRWGEAAERLRGAQDDMARTRESLARGEGGAADQVAGGAIEEQDQERAGG